MNLFLIAVVVPTMWLGLLWLTERLISGPSNNRWEGQAFLLNVLTLAPQMILAGIVQQLALLPIARRLPSIRATRLIAIVLALVAVSLVLVLMLRGDPGIINTPPVALALAVAVTVYGLLMRLPQRS